MKHFHISRISTAKKLQYIIKIEDKSSVFSTWDHLLHFQAVYLGLWDRGNNSCWQIATTKTDSPFELYNSAIKSKRLEETLPLK